MRVWLYYRLSRDEDAELNSLTNQRNILEEYAIHRRLYGGPGFVGLNGKLPLRIGIERHHRRQGHCHEPFCFSHFVSSVLLGYRIFCKNTYNPPQRGGLYDKMGGLFPENPEFPENLTLSVSDEVSA